MELKKGWKYYQVWAWAHGAEKINCGFVKCFHCTGMEKLCIRDRKSLYIEELNTYKCTKYPNGIPQEIITEKADCFGDMFHHPGCEDYDRCIYNVKEALIAIVTNEGKRPMPSCVEEIKSELGKTLPPWYADIIKEIKKIEEEEKQNSSTNL